MVGEIAIWTLILGAVNLALAVSVTIHAVLWKRDSRAVISWVGLAWLAPLAGSFIYFCFGINRVHRKSLATNLQRAWEHSRQIEISEADILERQRILQEQPNVRGLVAIGDHLTKRQLTPGNSVRPLENGDEAYPAMRKAIGEAERSVTLLSYIFDSDPAGDAFFDELVAAKYRGVEVRVLIDDVGSRYSRPNMASRLREAGIMTGRFMPTRVPRLPNYANLRNHRKILVVDGRIGFTGGTNIRHGHCLNDSPKCPVACLHFRLDGPVVEHLQEAFCIDWAFVTGEVLSGDRWFAAQNGLGPVWARGIAHGPDEDFEKLTDLMAGALAIADHSVRIVTPYFLPGAAMIQALNLAAMRGVNVEIFLPANNNILLVQWASAAQLWQILAIGCRVFSVSDPFDHTKLMVVDGVWTLIGSTNWDPRSLRLNFEFNVECYDNELAQRMNRIIDKKAKRSRPLTLDELNARSFPIRLRDGLSRLMQPYL